jgi:hypothetical protein
MNDPPDPPNDHTVRTVLLIALTLAAIAVSTYTLIRMD